MEHRRREEGGIDFFVAPLPPINGTYVPKPYGGLKMFYATIYVSKEAIDFMKWFTTDPQVAKILVQKLGYVPVIKDTQIQDPVVQGFYEAIKNVYLMPYRRRCNRSGAPWTSSYKTP